jgi:hypothetical protein
MANKHMLQAFPVTPRFFTRYAQLFSTFTLLVGFGVTSAQTLGMRVGPQLPYVTPDARSAGLGDASIALIDDFSGNWINPSTMAFSAKSGVNYSAYRISEDAMLQHLGFVVDMGDQNAIAGTFDILHFGGFNYYGNNSIRSRGAEMRTGFSYARRIADGLAAGVSVRLLNSTTDNKTVSAIASDVGVTYAPTRYIRYGFSIRNLGSDYDVTSVQVLQTDVNTKRLSQVIGLGLAFDYPFDEHQQRIVVGMDAEKILGEDFVLYKFGVEYQPVASVLFMRLGGRLRSSEFEPRVGLGLGVSVLRLDYAYLYSRRDGIPSHIATISASWN